MDLDGAFADTAAFDSALKRGELTEAIGLYRGHLLPDCLEEWALVERNQREQAYLTALESLANALLAQGEPANAVHYLRLLTTADPYRESAHGSLMQALADCGDTTAVTVVYQELRAKLRQELNAAPAPETEALYKQLSQQERPPAPALPAPTPPRESKRHLPVPLSDLIGRKSEIAELLEALGQRRLVTLLGAGGIGKTRLSIAVGDAALPRFEQGVWFVDLAALSDPSLVPQAAAKALGISEEPDRPLGETLADTLAPRSLLLVLDNCEHVLEASAALAYDLLSACPDLRILATSRQALDVMGEQVYRVLSLLVPPEDSELSDTHRLLEYDAIQLFTERASRVSSTFRLNARNAPAVVDICRQLDGIPLAIEMAAARMRALSVTEINSRLDNRFRLLTSGNRGVLPRHQTLRALIDWSYDHLSEAEQALLRRVSLFAGGWTSEAAEAVCTDTLTQNTDTLDLLSSLADKSLLVIDAQDDTTRYRLLETVRQYGLDRLTETDELLLFKERHRDYFLTLAETARNNMFGPEQVHWLATLDAEYDNLRQALAFCREDTRSGEPGLRLSAALWNYWPKRGYFTEGRAYYAAALAHPDAVGARTRERADALNGAGVLAFYQGDYAAAAPLHEEGHALCRELGDTRGTAMALANWGNVAAVQGDYATARARYEEALVTWRELNDTKRIATILNNLGNVVTEQGDYEAARRLQEESLEIEREHGNRQGVATSLNNLGILAEERGDYPAARALYEESLSIHRELGMRSTEASNLCGLGNVALKEGNTQLSYDLCLESLTIRRELGDRWGIPISLLSLAAAALELGDRATAHSLMHESLLGHQQIENTLGISAALASLATYAGNTELSARLWGATVAVRESIGTVLSPIGRAKQESEQAVTRDIIGDAAFTNAWNEGKAMTTEQAIALALTL
ncbi:MAG: tetratricopeptide repeat protein [Armatimonas sp.]